MAESRKEDAARSSQQDVAEPSKDMVEESRQQDSAKPVQMVAPESLEQIAPLPIAEEGSYWLVDAPRREAPCEASDRPSSNNATIYERHEAFRWGSEFIFRNKRGC